MWIESAQNLSIVGVAQRLGLGSRRSNSFSPCPACGAEERGSSDKRGPLGQTRDAKGWRCHVCGAGGDVVDLVSHAIKGDRFRNLTKVDQQEVKTWFTQEGVVLNNAVKPQPKPPRQRVRPPVLEVAELWKAASPLHRLQDTRPNNKVKKFLLDRSFDIDLLAQSKIVRVLPEKKNYRWPAWWPGTWSSIYRLAVPAFDTNGQLASIHVRAIGDKQVKPKSRWPKGFEAGGLFLANKQGIELLRGNPSKSLEGLLICEGITDMLRACCSVIHENMNIAVLSGTSGSFREMSKIVIPKNLNVYVATDPDEQGEQYASLIHKAVAPHTVYRLNLDELE